MKSIHPNSVHQYTNNTEVSLINEDEDEQAGNRVNQNNYREREKGNNGDVFRNQKNTMMNSKNKSMGNNKN